jgi:hypothetical protein
MSTRTKAALKVGNRTLQVSNLDKVLYPEQGITKAQRLSQLGNIYGFVLWQAGHPAFQPR